MKKLIINVETGKSKEIAMTEDEVAAELEQAEKHRQELANEFSNR